MHKSCLNCPIRQLGSLKAMGTEELKEVSASKTTKRVKKGEVLFSEGDQLNGVYCIGAGALKLSRLSSNGKDQIIKLATKGELVGQRSIISKTCSNLSATAISEMEVCYIPKQNLNRSVEKNPDFALEILRYVTQDLRISDETIANLSQKTVKQRIVIAFLSLKTKFGEDDQGFLKLTLSREDISNVVGTAVESAIRVISNFKKEGIIKTSGKRIAIQDSDKLEYMVRGF